MTMPSTQPNTTAPASEVHTCTIDNPATMCREGWVNGQLRFSYSVDLFAQGHWPPPARRFHMGANVGDWKTGQIFGDVAAMQPPQRKKSPAAQ
jgi:hypothetical protein